MSTPSASHPHAAYDALAHGALTSEQFEGELMVVRNRFSYAFAEMAHGQVTDGDHSEDSSDDLRLVWHAAEVALGILRKGYSPRIEAMQNVRELLRPHEED